MAADKPEPSHNHTELHKKSLSCEFVSVLGLLRMVLETGEEEGERRWK
jgi:hypothetical protein